MGKGITMGVGRGRSVIGITLGILIIECAIGAAAVALADESQGQYVDFVVWQLAWLTVPLLAVAAYWHPRRWGWFGVAAGVPQIVVGVVAMEKASRDNRACPARRARSHLGANHDDRFRHRIGAGIRSGAENAVFLVQGSRRSERSPSSCSTALPAQWCRARAVTRPEWRPRRRK